MSQSTLVPPISTSFRRREEEAAAATEGQLRCSAAKAARSTGSLTAGTAQDHSVAASCGGLDRVSATTLSWPAMWRMSVVNSAR